jgi:hypothetical protein
MKGIPHEHIVDVLLGARGTAGALGNPALLGLGHGAGRGLLSIVHYPRGASVCVPRAAKGIARRPLIPRIRIFSGDPHVPPIFECMPICATYIP